MIAAPMDWMDVARGAGLGLAVAAPIGPTAMLCVQRTLAGGAALGLATGYGAATAHVIYASVAAAGLALVADRLGPWSIVLQLGCAAFLLRMAFRTSRAAPRLNRPCGPRVIAARAYATGLLWTLGNPMTILGFTTLTAGIVGQEPHSWCAVPAIAAGVLLGSAAWWTVLATSVAHARRHLNERALRIANLVTAIALGVFAAVLLAKALTRLAVG